MGWKTEPCPRCGGPKAIVAKLCRACHGETTNSPVCPTCGGKKSYDSKQCRGCQAADGRSHKPCPSCGKRIQSAATQCRECYDRGRTEKAAQYLCADCRKPTKQYASTRFAERCWPCEMKRRRVLPKKSCSVNGCPRPHRAKGFCSAHYQRSYRPRPTGQFRGNRLKNILAYWPCQICGYDRMPSDIHRLTPGAEGGTYIPGNIVALCVRCHREVHRGVTLPPAAPTEEEIRATPTPLAPTV